MMRALVAGLALASAPLAAAQAQPWHGFHGGFHGMPFRGFRGFHGGRFDHRFDRGFRFHRFGFVYDNPCWVWTPYGWQWACPVDWDD